MPSRPCRYRRIIQSNHRRTVTCDSSRQSIVEISTILAPRTSASYICSVCLRIASIGHMPGRRSADPNPSRRIRGRNRSLMSERSLSQTASIFWSARMNGIVGDGAVAIRHIGKIPRIPPGTTLGRADVAHGLLRGFYVSDQRVARKLVTPYSGKVPAIDLTASTPPLYSHNLAPWIWVSIIPATDLGRRRPPPRVQHLCDRGDQSSLHGHPQPGIGRREILSLNT